MRTCTDAMMPNARMSGKPTQLLGAALNYIDSARVVEIDKDSPGIRLSYPGQPPQMKQLLNRLRNARLFAKNDTPEWFWARLNLALRTTIKKQRFEFH